MAAKISAGTITPLLNEIRLMGALFCDGVAFSPSNIVAITRLTEGSAARSRAFKSWEKALSVRRIGRPYMHLIFPLSSNCRLESVAGQAYDIY